MTRLVESRIIHLNGCEPSRIVLIDWGKVAPAGGRFTTHMEVLPENGPAWLCWTHHFHDLVEATEDFGTRFLADAEKERAQQQVVAA